ncbi:MAG TPA: aminopeptidase [Anaeromyxobacter sp.]|nr:aminopeptidase [Anaeromyxobacter sp.]
MARSKSKHIRTKSTRRQKWKARKRRQKVAKKATAKK